MEPSSPVATTAPSSIDTDFGNTLLLPNRNLDPAYQKVDLYGSYRDRETLSAMPSMQNLLNQNYQEVLRLSSAAVHRSGGNEVHLRRRVVEAELKTRD